MALASSSCQTVLPFSQTEATRLKFSEAVNEEEDITQASINQWLWVHGSSPDFQGRISLGLKPLEERGAAESIGRAIVKRLERENGHDRSGFVRCWLCTSILVLLPRSILIFQFNRPQHGGFSFVGVGMTKRQSWRRLQCHR